MDNDRKRALREAYKQRKPEMGVLAIRSCRTEEVFLGPSKDIPADINSNKAKLSMGTHPNKYLQDLWDTHGEVGFSFETLTLLEYEDITQDYTDDLVALRDLHLEQIPHAQKIWR